LDTLWWISGVFDCHLEKTKWEIVMWFTSDPKSEIWMDFSVLWSKNFFHFSHEFKRQMAVGEDDPLSGGHTLIDKLHGWDFHFFSHGYLTGWELLLFLGILIN